MFTELPEEIYLPAIITKNYKKNLVLIWTFRTHFSGMRLNYLIRDQEQIDQEQPFTEGELHI